MLKTAAKLGLRVGPNGHASNHLPLPALRSARARRFPRRLASGSPFTVDDWGDAGGGADDSSGSRDAGAIDATLAEDSGRVVDDDDATSDGTARDGGVTPLPEAGAQDAPTTSDPCSGGTVGVSSDAGSASHVSGYGLVEIVSPDDDPIVALTTTLRVPPTPPASGTVFLWPSLLPSAKGANFLPIDDGILQPVLTWGPTCAPGSPASSYASWWVSAQYVNTIGDAAGFTGCQGGTGMNAPVGDVLTMRMWLAGTTWNQTTTSAQTGQTVSYAIDLRGQSQNYAEFTIEVATSKSKSRRCRSSSRPRVLTFQYAAPASCQPFARGASDDYTAPRVSEGRHDMLLRPDHGPPAGGSREVPATAFLAQSALGPSPSAPRPRSPHRCPVIWKRPIIREPRRAARRRLRNPDRNRRIIAIAPRAIRYRALAEAVRLATLPTVLVGQQIQRVAGELEAVGAAIAEIEVRVVLAGQSPCRGSIEK